MKDKNKRRIKLMEYNINELREDLAEIDAELRELNTRMNRLENNLAGAAAPTTSEPAQVEVSFCEPTGALSGEDAAVPAPEKVEKQTPASVLCGVQMAGFELLPPALQLALSHLLNNLLTQHGVLFVATGNNPNADEEMSDYWYESDIYELTFILLWLWSNSSAGDKDVATHWFNVHAVDGVSFVLHLLPRYIEGRECSPTARVDAGASTIYLGEFFYPEGTHNDDDPVNRTQNGPTIEELSAFRAALKAAAVAALQLILQGNLDSNGQSLAEASNITDIHAALCRMFGEGLRPKWFLPTLRKYSIALKAALNEINE